MKYNHSPQPIWPYKELQKLLKNVADAFLNVDNEDDD